MKRQNLISTRKNKGYTQKEIAKQVKVTERHYRTLEAGTSNGSMKVWHRLSELFDKPIDFLLERKSLDNQ